ncbi:MAG: RluA family pseudouridine synthase [Kiritimatiellae bacterium]|nr:RluA family pseudouridine synthase [Kiritimatiellia bacterium]
MKNRPITVSAAEAGAPLDIFLARRLNISRKQAKRLLDERLVFVNGRRTWMARHPLQPEDRIEIPGAAAAAPDTVDAPLPILYRDGNYLVVHKPAGLPTNGAGSVEERLRRLLRLPAAEAVHRLDRDTTGCLWFALNPASREIAVALFKERAVTKTYHAIVAGRIPAAGVTITDPLDGLPAVTHVKLLSGNPFASHVKILIETGRTHQIRKHMASIRHPVLGDKSYLTRDLDDPRLREVPRQMLHASGLAFPHPATGETIRVKAPLPADFKRTLNRLRLGL